VDVGFYGKLPSHGDFLRRRASDAFVRVWDAWLQDCMTASAAALGERWLDVYLTSPAWRFAGAAGLCGEAPIVGVMVPSVDRVGRYFPLTIVAELPAHVSVVGAVLGAGSFFDRGERLAVETLAAEYVDFEAFDRQVIALAETLAFVGMPRVIFEPAAAAVLAGDSEACWHLPIGSTADVASAFEQVLSHRLSATHEPLMVWWSDGSSIVEPSCVIGQGLPRPDAFTALMDGSWQHHGWQMVPAHVHPAPSDSEMAVDEPPLSFRSAAASDVGRVRQNNQDAFIERSEIGIWVVADGLGGLDDGEHASRMVCDAFADFAPASSFEDTVDAARARVQAVNDHLRVAAAQSLHQVRSGSTVVVLLVRGRQCAVLWAGDSRVYRWRRGRLEQLTRDHHDRGVAGPGDDAQPDSHVVTQAVGIQTRLSLDVSRDQVMVGDRFLLCSDGLTRVLTEARIREWMESADIRTAVNGLVEATLAAGAPDNVTALVVEGYEFRQTAGLSAGLPDGSE
jgi:type VI secretion system protein ImpM